VSVVANGGTEESAYPTNRAVGHELGQPPKEVYAELFGLSGFS